MLNWFKKTAVAAKAAPTSDVAPIPGGDTVIQPAIRESEALKNQGNAHFASGNLEEAAACFRRAIERNPRYAEAYTNLGNVSYAQGDLEEAVALYRKAIGFKPDLFQALQNLGMALMDLGQNDAAEAALRRVLALAPGNAAAAQSLGVLAAQRGDFPQAETLLRRALELQPDYAEAHSNLGSLLTNTGRLPEAVASCRRALELKADYAEAHFNLGTALTELRRLDEAVASLRRAVELKPDFAEAYYNLGVALKAQGRLDEALTCFQEQARLTPEDGAAQHNIALLSGNNTERAPTQYVERLFNDYAHKFDTHLQQELKYEVPEKLVALITRHSMPHVEKWRVLDLGCGTGLVGSAIAPYARQLVGVDLSAKMLEKADARKLYQRLERLDLLTMLRGEETSSYDVITAADVFIYLGKLDEIIREIERLLCPGGYFAFSIEALVASSSEDVGREYRLEKTGRYTQSPDYMIRLASANGYLPQAMEPTQIRMENNKPVDGFLVLWQKPPARLQAAQ